MAQQQGTQLGAQALEEFDTGCGGGSRVLAQPRGKPPQQAHAQAAAQIAAPVQTLGVQGFDHGPQGLPTQFAVEPGLEQGVEVFQQIPEFRGALTVLGVDVQRCSNRLMSPQGLRRRITDAA